MRRLTVLLIMALTLGVWESVKADETITVSSTSSDIAAGLDLKAVAKLFASSKTIEEFETMLNNPDSSYVNLDLNGDGDIDYIRVVETGSGNNRLIVLQAILAKDIFQDVASIRVVKDEAQNVKVTITGDERIYGKDYVITPVFIYRPVIYDWFWGPNWYCWNSPYYWGYWPGWWRPVPVWGYVWYTDHIYAYHRTHPYCSFRYSESSRPGSRTAGPSVASRMPAQSAARTRYADQSTYVPNRVASTSTRTPRNSNATVASGATKTANTSTRSQSSARYTNYTNNANSTRSAVNTPARSVNNNYTTTTRSYSGSRSAGGYSGGGYSGSFRAAGGYSGQSVRR